MKATTLFKDFFNSEKAGGLVLIACTILSLLLANSNYGTSYHDFFQTQFAGHSFEHWINDGLMTIFFLLIGLELEREIYQGELSNIKDALLPIFGALGGMLIPAGICPDGSLLMQQHICSAEYPKTATLVATTLP